MSTKPVFIGLSGNIPDALSEAQQAQANSLIANGALNFFTSPANGEPYARRIKAVDFGAQETDDASIEAHWRLQPSITVKQESLHDAWEKYAELLKVGLSDWMNDPIIKNGELKIRFSGAAAKVVEDAITSHNTYCNATTSQERARND